MKLRVPVRRDTLGKDVVAGLVLGVESVPDGLAAGLLAGVNPLSGLYAYLFGTIGGSFFTSSTFMAVQATGAMAIVVADVPAVHSASDPARALFTLSVLTGVVMLAAGFLRLGSVLRFVSNAVMVGFISAVGVNIILGQLGRGGGGGGAGPRRGAAARGAGGRGRAARAPGARRGRRGAALRVACRAWARGRGGGGGLTSPAIKRKGQTASSAPSTLWCTQASSTCSPWRSGS